MTAERNQNLNNNDSITINKDNFATILNESNGNVKNVVNDLAIQCLNEEKVATEMMIKQQQDNTTMEEIKKNVEVSSVSVNTAISVFGYFYNNSIISNEKFSKNNIELGNKIKDMFINGNKQGTTFSINIKLIENELNLTKLEKDRIFGTGKYEGMKFGDYTIGQGSIKELKLDNQILNKIMNCHLKNENNEYIFRDFLILDGNGTILNTNNISNFDIGIIKNFAGQCDNNPEIINSICDFKLFSDKQINTHRFNSYVAFLSRVSGFKAMDENFKEYTDQIVKPYNNFKKVRKATTFTLKTGWKVGTTVYNTPANISLLKNKSELHSLSKKMQNPVLSDSQKKEIANKIKEKTTKITEVKNKLDKRKALQQKIGSPIKSYKQYKKRNRAEKRAKFIAKIKNSKLYNKLHTKITNSKFFNSSKKLAHNMAKPFRITGRFLGGARDLAGNIIFQNPISKLLRVMFTTVIRVVKISAIIIMIPLLIFLIFGMMGESGQQTHIVAIMPLATMDDFIEYQTNYDKFDEEFMSSLESFVQNKSINTNVKGEHIYYGINGMNNEENMKNNDYQNGIYYKYLIDNEHEGRTSNIEDLISLMAIMMSQQQSEYKEEAIKVLKWLYNLSHSYTYQESPLYACDSACHLVNYECNDHYHDYTDTDIKYNPFHAVNEHGGDYEIKIAENYCEVCSQTYDSNDDYYGVRNNTSCIVYGNSNATKENYYGCVSHSQCYHGNSGNMGSNNVGCSNNYPYYDCPGHEYSDGEDTYIEYCDGELGCEGYYVCEGHPHYSCDGHQYKCCLGHMDIQMNIKIKFAEELKDLINKYDFGENDYIAKMLNN